MYLHRETCHPYLEHAHLYERRKCHEHLQEVFTSLPKLEVELGSLAQNGHQACKVTPCSVHQQSHSE